MAGEKDRAKGTWDKTKGMAKEAAGEVTDDERLETEGKEDQVKGGAEKAVGKFKDAGEKVKEGVEEATR
jgi:uncharacterized protein YjbJ (UPF0337 family)